MHNEAHKRAANVMASTEEYRRLPAKLRSHLIRDITQVLAATVHEVANKEIARFYRPVDSTS